MREMDAGEGFRAEVVCAVGCVREVSCEKWQVGEVGESVWGWYTALVCLLIPGGVAGDVLGFLVLLLLLLSLKHLLEELELRGVERGEST